MSLSLNNSTASDHSFSKHRLNAKKKCLSGDYEEAMIKNKNTSELGKGSYGSVKLVKDKDDGVLYAMKIVTNIFFFDS